MSDDELTQTVDGVSEFSALQTVIGALQPLTPDARRRIVDATSAFLQLSRSVKGSESAIASTSRIHHEPSVVGPSYSSDTNMSPKMFLIEKQPRTDVERMACLAYYLTHYRNTPHFKTLDLSKLNTEAAQPKFANAANSTNNAVKMGYLVPAAKGHKQLSASGERFVLALPDREAAKLAMTSVKPRRKSKRAKNEVSTDTVG